MISDIHLVRKLIMDPSNSSRFISYFQDEMEED